MANYSAKTVDEFISSSLEEAQDHLRVIRKTVKSALPKAEETISYGKPYYKYPKHVVGFDVYKHHINFEIYRGQLTSADRQELESNGYKTGNKSFQIQHSQSVPVAMIKKIARAQVDFNEHSLSV